MDKEVQVTIDELVDEYIKAYNDEMFKHIQADMEEINRKIDEIYKIVVKQ